MTRENIIEKQISRSNRNLLLLLAAIALIWLLIFSDAFWEKGFKWPIVLGFLFGIVMLGWALKVVQNRRANLYTHPDMKCLGRFGASLSDVVRAIDSEVKLGVIYESSGTLVTPNWMIRPRMFGVDVFHSTEFAWIYPDKITHRGTFFSSYRTGVVVRVSQKRMTSKVITQRAPVNRQSIDDYAKGQVEVEVTGGEENVQKLLIELHQHAPWAIVGFDKQTDKLWRSNPSALFATVQNRQDRTVYQSLFRVD